MAVADLRVPASDGVELHVRRTGEETPSGREFLLVHGLSSNALLWDEVAARLAGQGHTAYAVDLRSHGTSDAPPSGYDTGTAARDVAAVGDALGVSHAIVAGQSWGGNVVVRLAAERPDLVAALALIDGGWLDLPADFDSWESVERALKPPELAGLTADALRGYLRREHPGWSPTAIDATVANLIVRDDGTLERRLSIPHHMAIVRSMWEDPPAPYLARVQAPTLLLPALGDASRAPRKRDAIGRATAALAHATVKEYPGGDHDLHAQQPEAIAADLLDLAASVAVP